MLSALLLEPTSTLCYRRLDLSVGEGNSLCTFALARWTLSLNRISLSKTFLFDRVSSPTPRGSVSHFGPADPGLKSSVLLNHLVTAGGMANHADIRLFALKKGSSFLHELSAFVQNMPDGDAEACQFDHGLW